MKQIFVDALVFYLVFIAACAAGLLIGTIIALTLIAFGY